MVQRIVWLGVCLGLLNPVHAAEPIQQSANRLLHLQSNSPYEPSLEMARLITPQWIGEEGVDAVVVLAIDDMRDEARYEAYLRPILNRLKKIDGRAPVSIMTCSVNPGSPLHQQWLEEGLSVEVHTLDHPCPILSNNDFPQARRTYERCVDLLGTIPGSRPVAFRTPCCDSLNTVSPRFFAGIFNQRTPEGNFLTIDSSVFVVFNAKDPALPRSIVERPDGQPRFERYVPQDRAFGNLIENYPYPYIVQNRCWEFPCMVPSDWAAQHLQQPNNPQTLEDWKKALDATVIKQGVMNLVFHPHGWIKSEQVVELIDHAVETYGKRVKFLTFREAQERLNVNVLDGRALRDQNGDDAGVRLMDLNGDGYQDVLTGTSSGEAVRVWDVGTQTWKEQRGRLDFDSRHAVFASVSDHAMIALEQVSTEEPGGRRSGKWRGSVSGARKPGFGELSKLGLPRASEVRMFRLADVDGNGHPEWIGELHDGSSEIYELSSDMLRWNPHRYRLPQDVRIGIPSVFDSGLRLVDLDSDGDLDILFSDQETALAAIFDSNTKGWSRVIRARSGRLLPPFIKDGIDAGVWFYDDQVWIQNESTASKPDLVERVSFEQILSEGDPPPKSPEESQSSIRLPDGFVAELVAAEPLVQDPVAFDWGTDGRLWVVEMADYPDMPNPPGPSGRVKVLTDVDGDGIYDKATVFADRLNSPNGVMPWKDGVLISAAPDILFARDVDEDNRADDIQKLYSGFEPGNQQHRVNGFILGLDNWVHCANGDSGGVITSHKTGQKLDLAGRDFRIQPDTGRIELVTGRTQFGRRRDDAGNWFGCNNSNPMFHFVLAERYLRRNPHLRISTSQVSVPDIPGAAPCFPISKAMPRFNDFDRLNRFTSACSAMVYRDNLLGREFTNTMLVSEPVHNLVHREQLRTDGVEFHSSRFKSETDSEFLASTDNWFRPTMIRTGPDGALWIADMYRLVIEHPQYIPADVQKEWDLTAGSDRGRIYRVFRKEEPPRKIAKLSDCSNEELVRYLESPNGWTRDHAQRLLVERRASDVAELLRRLLQESDEPLARLHALCALEGMGKVDSSHIQLGLMDSDSRVVRQAMRIAEKWSRIPRVVNHLVAHEGAKDPFVRLQLACSLGEFASPKAAEVLAGLAEQSIDDKWLRIAVLSSVNSGNVVGILEQLQKSESLYDSRSIFIELVDLAVRLGHGEFAMAALVELINSDQLDTGDRLNALFEMMPVLHDVPDNHMQRKSGVKVTQLLQNFNAVATLSVQNGPKDKNWSTSVRFLGRSRVAVDATRKRLLEALSPQLNTQQQFALIESLTARRSVASFASILGIWRRLTPSIRTRVIDRMLSSSQSVKLLLDSIEDGTLGQGDLSPLHRQTLVSYRVQDLRERGRQLLSASSNTTRTEIVAAYSRALEISGDIEAGRVQFEKRCSVCHRLSGIGKQVGPDLAALSDPAPQKMLASILDPNRNVESKFQAYTAVTTAGLTHSGLLTDESGGSLTLLSAEGRRTTLVRSELEELVNSGRSFMPEGLERDIGVEQMADLLAFLTSKGPSPKKFAGNMPEVIRQNPEGQYSLQSSQASIFGDSLVFEQKYGNLGFWGSGSDRAQWEIEVSAEGQFDVVMDYACPADAAGNQVRVRLGTQTVDTRIQSTGSWDQYREFVVGKVTLAPGTVTLVVNARPPLQGFLFDLRRIRLVPSKR